MVAADRSVVLDDAPIKDGVSFFKMCPFLDRLVVDGLVAIPVHPIKKFVADNSVCDIPVIFDDREIGSICLLSQIIQSESTVSSLTSHQYAAYLTLSPLDAVAGGGWVPFAFDAIVLKYEDFWCYWRNRESSSLWGGFVSISETDFSQSGKVKSTSENVVMYANCKARTSRHRECLEFAALSNDLTDRFLHLYHYLELDYDYEVVRQIKLIDEENPRGLWDVLKLQQADTDRLFHILKDYPLIDFLEKLIYGIQSYPASAIRIFYEYGKDSNPLKSEEAFSLQFLLPPTISRAEMDSVKKNNKLGDDFAAKPEVYAMKLVKLACYWIYRFRCSIAHNKLGEYYLNRSDDIDLLAKFGEPLLREMVRYRMTR